MSATTAWPPAQLDCLSATQLVRYAVACMEHEAHRLVREMQLSMLPLEAMAGGREIRNHLEQTARQWLDLPSQSAARDPLSDEERANIEAGIAEIERELAAAHPWYAEDVERSRGRQIGRAGKVRQQWVGDRRLLGDVRRWIKADG